MPCNFICLLSWLYFNWVWTLRKVWFIVACVLMLIKLTGFMTAYVRRCCTLWFIVRRWGLHMAWKTLFSYSCFLKWSHPLRPNLDIRTVTCTYCALRMTAHLLGHGPSFFQIGTRDTCISSCWAYNIVRTAYPCSFSCNGNYHVSFPFLAVSMPEST